MNPPAPNARKPKARNGVPMKNRLPIAISLFALSATALVMDGGAPAGAAIGLTPVLSPVWSAAPSATSSIHETAAAAKRRGKGRAGARSGAGAARRRRTA